MSLKRYEIKREMEDLALQKGFLPFQPALFEKYEQFACKYSNLSKDQLVVVMNGQQQLLLLRPDITTAMIKEILPYMSTNDEVKLFYQSTNYRSSNKAVKEIGQFGIEILGNISTESEIELIEMACNYLQHSPFILEIGDTGFLEGLFEEANLNKIESDELRKNIYSKDYNATVQFANEKGLSSTIKEVINNLFTLQGKVEKIKQLSSGYILNPKMEEAVNSIAKFNQISPNLYFDLSMINELDYYDGVIFKGYFPNLPKEVLSGGRYDALTEDFGQKIGAIGFSIDVNSWIKTREEVDK